jgi:DNA helicase II / ATP-dependent DNA helicase PcrA
LAIVDDKAAKDDERKHDQQLRIYAAAGQREGLNVRAAFVHDLTSGERLAVDISPAALDRTETEAINIVKRIQRRDFVAAPGKQCRRCDVKRVCRHAVA